MDYNPKDDFMDHIRYQTELLEEIADKLKPVRTAALIFIGITAFGCILQILWVTGLISIATLMGQ